MVNELTDKLRVLKEIAEFLNEETDKFEMIQGVLNLLIDNTNYDTAWIIFIDDKGKHELVGHYQLPERLAANNYKFLKDDTCWCVQKFNNNELPKASNIIACSRLEKANRNQVVDEETITHHATVPLLSGEERYGILNVGARNKRVYDEDELHLLESIGFQIGSTLRRIELNDQEKETIIVRERQRLARELHDSVNQMLFSISITANAAQKLTSIDKVYDTFNRVETTARHAMQEMKALIWQLKPIGLENGLINAIEQYAALIDIKVDITIDGFYKVPDYIETQLYRITQEALNNVRKHAQTDIAHIHIELKDDAMQVIIRDDGIGFDIDLVKPENQGLKNMKERMDKLGGIFQVLSSKYEGTIIKLNFSL